MILFSVRVLTVSATQDWHSQPPSQCDHVDLNLTGTTHMACPRLSSCSRWLVLPSKYTPKGMLLSPSSAPCQPPTCLLGLCQWPLEFSTFPLIFPTVCSPHGSQKLLKTQIRSYNCLAQDPPVPSGHRIEAGAPASGFWAHVIGCIPLLQPPLDHLPLCSLCSWRAGFLCFFTHDLSASHLLPLLSRFTGITHSLSKLPLSS